MAELYAILLAGGYGTRLWPVSRKGSPKQLTPILGDDSLFMRTLRRLRKGLPYARIIIVTNAAQAALVREQAPDFPEENLLVEPVRRETAAAIGFGAAVIHARDPKAVVIQVSSDAHVKDDKEYWRVLRLAARAAVKAKRLCLIGIRPRYPETGYGYIKMGSQAMRFPKGGGKADEVFEVERFVEKPDLETAKTYVAQWEYLWNPSIIAGPVARLLGAYKKHLPDMYKRLTRIAAVWHTAARERVLAREFPKIEPISVDYGINEKEKGMLVVPADWKDWADVGHWRAVHEVLARTPSANVTRGRHVTVDAEGNLLYSFTGKLIAAAGVKNMIVVETEDAIMICPKDRAQDVKKLVEQLEKKKMKKYL